MFTLKYLITEEDRINEGGRWTFSLVIQGLLKLLFYHHSNNTTESQILTIAQTLKAIDFLLKESVLITFIIYTKKDSGVASIHRIDKLFPLKASLVTISEIGKNITTDQGTYNDL